MVLYKNLCKITKNFCTIQKKVVILQTNKEKL